ncbi:MAG: hypothetical protein ACOYZ7_08505 [Chloroflexota bacterium]
MKTLQMFRGAALCVLLVCVVTACGSTSQPTPPATSPTRVIQSPPTATVSMAAPAAVQPAGDSDVAVPVAEITLPGEGIDLAVAEDAIWVLLKGNQISRIDPATHQIVATIPIQLTGPNPAVAEIGALTVGEGAVWLAATNEIIRLDPATGETTHRIIPPQGEELKRDVCWDYQTITVGEGAVWVGCHEGWVIRLDPATNDITAAIAVLHEYISMSRGAASARHLALAVENGVVWAAYPHLNTIIRIDPATNQVVAQLDLEQAGWFLACYSPDCLAVTENAVWAQVAEDKWARGQQLLRIDPGTNQIVGSILDQEPVPIGVVVDEAVLWVNRQEDILRLDPFTSRTTGQVVVSSWKSSLRHLCGALAVGADSLWCLAEIVGNPLYCYDLPR